MTLAPQLPLFLEVLPNGGELWQGLILLLKINGESRKDSALIAIHIMGHGLDNLWWYKNRKDRPSISICEMLRSTRNKAVVFFETPVPSEMQIRHLLINFCTDKARLLYYPNEPAAVRNKTSSCQVKKRQKRNKV